MQLTEAETVFIARLLGHHVVGCEANKFANRLFDRLADHIERMGDSYGGPLDVSVSDISSTLYDGRVMLNIGDPE